jgi:hypothetical protein
MTKDSQVDNKRSRKIKSKGQIPLTEENRNQNRTEKNNPSGATMYKRAV